LSSLVSFGLTVKKMLTSGPYLLERTPPAARAHRPVGLLVGADDADDARAALGGRGIPSRPRSATHQQPATPQRHIRNTDQQTNNVVSRVMLDISASP
jgi:hypothetical protein